MLESLSELDKRISELNSLLEYVYTHWVELEEAFKTGSFDKLEKLRLKGKKGRFIELEFTP